MIANEDLIFVFHHHQTHSQFPPIYGMRKTALLFRYVETIFFVVDHAQIQRGAGGLDPLGNHKAKGFLRQAGPDPLENLKYQASIQCWAIIGPPVKRHLNGVSLAGQ